MRICHPSGRTLLHFIMKTIDDIAPGFKRLVATKEAFFSELETGRKFRTLKKRKGAFRAIFSKTGVRVIKLKIKDLFFTRPGGRFLFY